MGSRWKYAKNKQVKMTRDEIDTQTKAMKSIGYCPQWCGLCPEDNWKLLATLIVRYQD